MSRLALAVLTFCMSLRAAPTVAAAGVRNAASNAHPLFPNGSIAQGSLFVVYGSAMGPGQVQFAGDFPLPTSLAGTSINVTVGGAMVSCPIVFTYAFQLAAILPSNTPLGGGTLVVSYNGSSNAAPIKVVTSSPGIFTVNQQGSGPGVIQDGLGRQNAVRFAFNPGQTVVAWGTGLGPISGGDANAPPVGNIPGVTITANIGGQNAEVVYAGRSSNAGLDQINIKLPAGIAGCYLPLYVVATPANGQAVTSNLVTISIASSGSVCSDPNRPGLANPNGYASGDITLLPGVAGTGSGSFTLLEPADLATASGANFLDLPNGSCSVFQTNGSPIPMPHYIDGGSVLNVTGPFGAQHLQMRYTSGTYTVYFGPVIGSGAGPQQTPPYMPPGIYTFDNGIGGADVGPFKISIALPEQFTWNEPSIKSVDRSQPLSVTWSGGDPNARVQIMGTSVTDLLLRNSMSFVCFAKGSDQKFTVPAAILSLLPPGVTGFLGSTLAVSSTNSVNGSAPGLDNLTVNVTYKPFPAASVSYK